MPNYVNKSLSIFQHKKPKHDQHSPHPHATPNYGAKIQYAPPSTTSNLTESQIIYCQLVIVTFLFYAHTINSIMLTAVGYIATHISIAQWDNIENRINQFLDYAATHPDAKVTYHKSNMHLWFHTDATYLTEPKSRSRAWRYRYFINKTKLPIQYDDPTPKHNHHVLFLIKFVDVVMSSTQ